MWGCAVSARLRQSDDEVVEPKILKGMRKESCSADHGLQVSRFPFRKVVVGIPWEQIKELKGSCRPLRTATSVHKNSPSLLSRKQADVS